MAAEITDQKGRPITTNISRSAAGKNLGPTDRLASIALGSGLLLYGVKRRRIISTLLGSFFLYRGAAGQCGLYRTIGIDTATPPGERKTSVAHRRGIKVTSAAIIDRPAADLYHYWRDLGNFPNFMSRLESVESTGKGRSRWVFRAVAGKRIVWNAEIINEIENELIAWRSLAVSDLDHAGSVRFKPAPGGRGTQVMVAIEYRPPAGTLGIVAAKIFGAVPEQLLQNELKRFKQLLETGEIATVAGQPRGNDEA